jgi:hypothetical protein
VGVQYDVVVLYALDDLLKSRCIHAAVLLLAHKPTHFAVFRVALAMSVLCC